MPSTPFKIVGVPPTATDEDIKKAYRRAALRCHPDKVPSEQREEATVRFQELSNAYDQIKDASSRSEFAKREDPSDGGGTGDAADWLNKKASEDRADRYEGSPLQHAYDIFESAFSWETERAEMFRQLMPMILRDYGPAGEMIMSEVSKRRNREKTKSLLGYLEFEELRAPIEIKKMSAPRRVHDAPVRVVCIRHGMGQHQEVSGGVASVVSRDATLTETGIEEAARAGSLMKEAGLFQQRVLVVISPFTRTLQTAICVFGTPQWELPTLIEPKAGEIKPIVAIKDSTKRNALKILGVGKALGATQQGDRGSTPKELNIKFPPHMHPQFGGFCAVERYCASHGDMEGKWWHHGHSSGNENNRADALDRCENLRRGIVQAARERGCDTVLLVSHGGFLKMAFDQEKNFENCEFRVFDLDAEGQVQGIRIREGGGDSPPAGGANSGASPGPSGAGNSTGKASRAPPLLLVENEMQLKGHKVYIVKAKHYDNVKVTLRFDDVKNKLYNPLKKWRDLVDSSIEIPKLPSSRFGRDGNRLEKLCEFFRLLSTSTSGELQAKMHSLLVGLGMPDYRYATPILTLTRSLSNKGTELFLDAHSDAV